MCIEYTPVIFGPGIMSDVLYCFCEGEREGNQMLGPGALIYIVELKLHCLAQIPQFLSKYQIYMIFLYIFF